MRLFHLYDNMDSAISSYSKGMVQKVLISSVLHSLFGLAVSLLLIEVIFFRCRKIPFTCSYLPGKEKMHVLWTVYTAGFILYVTLLTALELSFFKNSSRFYMFYVAILILVIASNLFHSTYSSRNIKLKFEEKPELVMLGLASSDS